MTLDPHSNRITRMAARLIQWLPSAGGKKGFAVWYTAIHDDPVEIWIALPALSAATGQALGADERRVRAVLLEYSTEIEACARQKARSGQNVVVLDDAELSSVDWRRRSH